MNTTKQFGIRMTLPVEDTFRLPHLLGDDFASTRWFNDEMQRDQFLSDYASQFVYYREGDVATLRYEPIERDI